MELNFSDLKFDEKGLIPVVVQDCRTKEVLTLAYMNQESLKMTIEKGETYFFSRSRNEIWHKGETSGNYQKVKSISYDCDCDSILIQVEPLGPTCHTGNRSCFYRSLVGEKKEDILTKLYDRIVGRKNNPVEGSYTNYLFTKGIDKILKKIGEEAAEVIIAGKNQEKHETIYESADLIYHLFVLLVEKGITLEEIYEEIEKRYKK